MLRLLAAIGERLQVRFEEFEHACFEFALAGCSRCHDPESAHLKCEDLPRVGINLLDFFRREKSFRENKSVLSVVVHINHMTIFALPRECRWFRR